jgi:ribosome modulation factor
MVVWRKAGNPFQSAKKRDQWVQGWLTRKKRDQWVQGWLMREKAMPTPCSGFRGLWWEVVSAKKRANGCNTHYPSPLPATQLALV